MRASIARKRTAPARSSTAPYQAGSPVARCIRHFDERLARYESSIERYAASDAVPSWFDPSYAGERWDDE